MCLTLRLTVCCFGSVFLLTSILNFLSSVSREVTGPGVAVPRAESLLPDADREPASYLGDARLANVVLTTTAAVSMLASTIMILAAVCKSTVALNVVVVHLTATAVADSLVNFAAYNEVQRFCLIEDLKRRRGTRQQSQTTKLLVKPDETTPRLASGPERTSGSTRGEHAAAASVTATTTTTSSGSNRSPADKLGLESQLRIAAEHLSTHHNNEEAEGEKRQDTGEDVPSSVVSPLASKMMSMISAGRRIRSSSSSRRAPLSGDDPPAAYDTPRPREAAAVQPSAGGEGEGEGGRVAGRPVLQSADMFQSLRIKDLGTRGCDYIILDQSFPLALALVTWKALSIATKVFTVIIIMALIRMLRRERVKAVLREMVEQQRALRLLYSNRMQTAAALDSRHVNAQTKANADTNKRLKSRASK